MTEDPELLFSKLTPIESMEGDDPDDTRLLQEMATEAKEFLLGFPWVTQIVDIYASEVAVGGIVAVFLFRIIPASSEIDEWLWVVVGDLPPAYLVADSAPDGESALRNYVDEMSAWANAVSEGRETDALIPVNVAPTVDNAVRLLDRLDYISTEILD
ncbi:MAG: hypothetical protein WD627_01990 [Actinomycetota bacterium]